MTEKMYLIIRQAGGTRCYPLNPVVFSSALQEGKEFYAPSKTNGDFVKVIFLCNPSASCGNKHQDSLSPKTFIHSLTKCGKHEAGRHYR